MINEEKVITTLQTIGDTCFIDLNPEERIVAISNLLLIESERYFPKELKDDFKSIVANGKRISYELLQHEDNFGLNLAAKAHILILELNQYKELESV